jgi:sodium transport system permease protein
MRAWRVARKELREGLRDRRSLMSGLFYGIWGPAVMGAALIGMARQHADLGAVTIATAGAAHAPSLVAHLASRNILIADGVTDAEAAIRDRRVAVALLVDEDYATRFTRSQAAEVTLLHDSTWPESSRLVNHVRSALNDYARAVGDTRLVMRGVAPSAIAALHVVDRDFSTAADRAGRALATMPIFVLLAAFIGGMSIAADVTAGERERGSLESLLLHPISHLAITGGKWLAVSAMACLTVALALAVSFAVMQHPRLQDLDLPIGMTPLDALQMFAILAPLAAGAAAFQLYIALQAHTFKEAQSKLSMLIFLPMLPGFMFAFGTLQPAPWMAFAPMIGQHMLITTLVRGETLAIGPALLLSAITVAVGAAAWIAAASQLRRETVLRRSAA